jgi:hypothetical protein
MRRSYSGGAKPAYLTVALGGTTGDLTITCDDLSNWPTGSPGPFYVVIDRNLVSEEKILCSSRTGNIITVYSSGLSTGRGSDGTTISAHSIGAEIEHVFTATDADEANAHVNNAALHITAATAAARPSPPTANQVIVQTDTETLWSYIGGQWVEVSGVGAQGAGTDRIFWENGQTVTGSYTLPSGTNAGTFGPVTIDSGVTVTIPSGSVWTVV